MAIIHIEEDIEDIDYIDVKYNVLIDLTYD